MNCLMIGGGGFIGAYTSRALLQDGHNVVILDAHVKDNSLYKILSPDELEHINIIDSSVTDLPFLLQVFKKHRIDSVVNLASWQIPACHQNPTQAITINGLGFNYILEAAAIMELRRVVWTSTNAVFGSPKYHPIQPIPNDDFHKPNTVYGALKSLNEYMAEHFYTHRNVDSIGLRFCLVYGYGRLRGASAFASEMIQKAVTGETCVIENGDTIVDWFYVVDAAKLILQALKAPTTKTRIFNTHSELHSVREAAELLMRLEPKADFVIKGGTIDANWYLDNSLLKEELGFSPSFRLEDGLRDALRIASERELRIIE